MQLRTSPCRLVWYAANQERIKTQIQEDAR
jgi:hypothetical protein